jgi:carboxylesterase type B
VYFHAGEFVYGSSNDKESNWPYFTKGGAVLVTANSRLSSFGFAALESLRSRDPSGSSGNYGMQDQRALLKWVKDTIASFGGDAKKITIFGESSGGSSVGFHLSSKASRDLFSQAILESPGLTQSKSWETAVANTQYVISGLTAASSEGCLWPAEVEWSHYPGLVVSEMGSKPLAIAPRIEAHQLCAKRSDCFMVTTTIRPLEAKLWGGPVQQQKSIYLFNVTMALAKNPGMDVYVRKPHTDTATQCLQKAKAADIVDLSAGPPYGDTFETDRWAPTVDGVELPEALKYATVSALASGKPLLGGSNMDEGTMFMYDVPFLLCNASDRDLADWSLKMYGEELGAEIPKLYEHVEEPTPLCKMGPRNMSTTLHWVAAMRSAGDQAITCRMREVLRKGQELGSNVWWYYFTHTPLYSMNSPQTEYLGAFHGAEVPFVFGDGFELRSDAEKKLSEAMGCYWTNFADTGNPNHGDSGCAEKLALPKWPVFGQGDALELSVDMIHSRENLLRPQCDLFAKYYRPAGKTSQHSVMV